jgi:hypothetical protein
MHNHHHLEGSPVSPSKIDDAVQRYVDERDLDENEGGARALATYALGRLARYEYLMATVLLAEKLAGSTAGGQMLDREQALHLAVQMINSEVVKIRIGTSDMQRDLVLKHVTTVHENDQAAAFAALRQLGGWRKVGVPEWLESALGDQDTWTACQDVIDLAELAVRHTNPGRRWTYVETLGYVVYQGS